MSSCSTYVLLHLYSACRFAWHAVLMNMYSTCDLYPCSLWAACHSVLHAAAFHSSVHATIGNLCLYSTSLPFTYAHRLRFVLPLLHVYSTCAPIVGALLFTCTAWGLCSTCPSMLHALQSNIPLATCMPRAFLLHMPCIPASLRLYIYIYNYVPHWFQLHMRFKLPRGLILHLLLMQFFEPAFLS